MWIEIGHDRLEEFKASWPCHGLGDLYNIHFEFAHNGDLVDIEAYNEHGQSVDSAQFDGPALLALSQEAQEALQR